MQQLGYDGWGVAFTVGCCAIAALDTAIDDETFDPDDIDLNLTDNQDTEGNDASFFAACAYAGRPVGQTVSGENNVTRKNAESPCIYAGDESLLQVLTCLNVDFLNSLTYKFLSIYLAINYTDNLFAR